MIRVYADRQGERCRLLVLGHACSTPEGRLVCAAVSALTQALAGYAKNNPVCRHVRVSRESGSLFLSCRSGLGDAFDMTAQALLQLADEYPQNVVYCTEKSAI